jgi:nucleoid-associated protein YgaU
VTGEGALLATAMLLCTDLESAAFGEVKFDLNPDTIEMTRKGAAGGSARATSPNATGLGASMGKGVSPSSSPPASPAALSISFTGNFFGLMTQMNCEQLLSWVNHAALLRPSMVPIIATRPPLLTFIWGPPVGGFVVQCIMTSCQVTYNRFLPTGTPIRASARLTLQEHAPLFPGTNPTSGGVPGRGAHVLHAGENLQSLARKHYGTERAWRRIAQTNGIDDPLRVGAGRALYLPSAETDQGVGQ